MREIAVAAMPLAAFFTVGPALLLLMEKPGTPGFVITVFTLFIGVIFLTLALVLHRIAAHLERRDEYPDIPGETTASPRGGMQ